MHQSLKKKTLITHEKEKHEFTRKQIPTRLYMNFLERKHIPIRPYRNSLEEKKTTIPTGLYMKFLKRTLSQPEPIWIPLLFIFYPNQTLHEFPRKKTHTIQTEPFINSLWKKYCPIPTLHICVPWIQKQALSLSHFFSKISLKLRQKET